MRRRALFASLVAACLAASAARASEIVVEIGLRAGYIFGRGWTLGAGVSFDRGGVPASWFAEHELAALGGLAASADLTGLGDEPLDLRLHVGPEIAFLHACRAFGGAVTGGAVWSLRRGAPARFGFDVGGTLLAGVVVDGPGGNPLFVGPAYRYAELLDGENAHELALETRLFTLPFDDAPFKWAGVCSALGGEPTKVFR